MCGPLRVCRKQTPVTASPVIRVFSRESPLFVFSYLSCFSGKGKGRKGGEEGKGGDRKNKTAHIG